MAIRYDSRPAGAVVEGGHFWNDPTVRGILYQILVAAGVVLVLWYFISNTIDNLERLGIAAGYGFLERESGFSIGESLIEFSPASTYGRAFVVGLLNTVKVAALGIVFATILGTLVGVGRLSSNWLLARLTGWYVEGLRNVPLLLQLFVWHAVIRESLPAPRDALNPLPGIYLSNRGFQIPAPVAHPAFAAAGIAFLVGIVGVVLVRRWARARQAATGEQLPVFWMSVGLIVGLPLLVWLAWGAPILMEIPALGTFNIRGGVGLSPEFAAMLLGLTSYTSAFIAEIVRAGILGVSWGQTEAGLALGLSRGRVLRLIILPQALRIIIPPTTSQYLNLTKNSSLAVAIGYPELVSIGNTTMNQTGRALEAVSIFMAVYLTFSLLISLFMNWYNRKIALVER